MCIIVQTAKCICLKLSIHHIYIFIQPMVMTLKYPGMWIMLLI